MTMPLRHSHVAVRGPISSLARAAKKVLSEDEDDFGRYRFFDLTISPGHGEPQRVRFAAHEGDRMVHVLAERIEATDDLAKALRQAGVYERSQLSISTDQNDQPLRSIDEMHGKIVETSGSYNFKPRFGGRLSGKIVKSIYGFGRHAEILPQDVGSRLRLPGKGIARAITITPQMVGLRVKKLAPGVLVAKQGLRALRDRPTEPETPKKKTAGRLR